MQAIAPAVDDEGNKYSVRWISVQSKARNANWTILTTKSRMKSFRNFDPADMETAEKAFYGREWQSKLAHALGVDPR